MTETAAVVALLRLGGRPASHYADLLEASGSGTEALEHELAEDEHGQTSLSVGRSRHELIAEAETDLGVWSNQGIEVLTVLDPDFPVNLRLVHDRPPLIFLSGRIEPRDRTAVAVIGTREPTPNGIERAQQLTTHLVEQQITVISGLAAGIDTVAHTTALRRNARTIAVIATGLHHSYPPENQELQAQIAKHGGVVSQFWPDAGPTKQSFPQRNALMSGLSQATVIVEAWATSGTRIQARRALAHGRPVFLHETLLQQPWARELSAQPATYVFATPDEITDRLERLTDPGSLVA
jgi:DNA processing protein